MRDQVSIDNEIECKICVTSSANNSVLCEFFGALSDKLTWQ